MHTPARDERQVKGEQPTGPPGKTRSAEINGTDAAVYQQIVRRRDEMWWALNASYRCEQCLGRRK